MKKVINIFLSLILVSFISQANAATIKWSMPGDSLTLDPHAQNEGPTHMVSRQVYESLVTRGLDMSIEPQLATSWEATDPETWVFTLRDGVTFSDGKALRASDVEFSISHFRFVCSGSRSVQRAAINLHVAIQIFNDSR